MNKLMMSHIMEQHPLISYLATLVVMPVLMVMTVGAGTLTVLAMISILMGWH